MFNPVILIVCGGDFVEALQNLPIAKLSHCVARPDLVIGILTFKTPIYMRS